jgi:hypothetical protein
MAENETVYVLCDNGAVMPHDLPLPSGIADRVARGQLRLVNEDGSAIQGDASTVRAPAPDGPPAGTAEQVLAWVGDDPQRAAAALDAEKASEKPRKGLVSALEPLVQ